MTKRAVDRQTDNRQTNYMERERGRKSYFLHNMRQDVAILCLKTNTIATKPVSAGLPGLTYSYSYS
jgi:hypothetical protein